MTAADRHADSRDIVPRLVRIVVKGGYLDGLDVEIPPGGCVVIGEHGVGKSTLLAFIRFVLALTIPAALLEEHESLLEKNLANGRVYLTFETPATGVLTFSRALTRPKGKPDVPHDPPRFEAAMSRPGAVVTWSPDLFPVHFSGHGELARLAFDGAARLELIERFAGKELGETREALAKVREAAAKQNNALREVEEEIDRHKQASAPLEGELALLAQLKAEAGTDPVDIEAANARKALRERERLMMDGVIPLVDGAAGEVSRVATLWARRLAQGADPEVLRGPNAKLIESVGQDLARISALLTELGTTVTDLCEKARASFAEIKVTAAAARSHQEDAYRELVGKHEHNAARAHQRVNLEGRVAVLQKAREEYATKVEEKATVVAALDRLLERQEALVVAEKTILRDICARLTEATGKVVTVTLEEDIDRAPLKAVLLDIVKKRNFEGKQIEAIANAIAARDLFQMVVDGDPTRLAAVLGSTTTAERFITVVRERRRQYDLRIVPTIDHPGVFLKHGTETKRDRELSSGQRIATFVRLMLLDRRGPFISDTPENDVSGIHLATQLCPALADLGTWGQYIVVSHDPNVPILGKARKIIELHSPDGACGVVREAGPPKQVIIPMENHLEGGREAFTARKTFYDDR